MRAAVFIGPVIAFFITRRWCISLQRHDSETLLHGYETGIIMRSPEGGYTERHLPSAAARAYTLTARDRDEVLTSSAPAPDANGVAAPRHPQARSCAARLSTLMYADNVQKPTARGARGGAPPRRARARAPGRPRGHAADGHQFDGHHPVDDEHSARTDRTAPPHDRPARTHHPSGGPSSSPTRRLFTPHDADPSLVHALRRRPVARSRRDRRQARSPRADAGGPHALVQPPLDVRGAAEEVAPHEDVELPLVLLRHGAPTVGVMLPRSGPCHSTPSYSAP